MNATTRRTTTTAALAFAGLTALTGCGQAASGATAGKAVTSASDKPAGYVDKTLTGAKAWPLTVASAVLHCNNYAVSITAAGNTYALNGLATDRKIAPEFPDNLWRNDPKHPGLGGKVNIGPLIQKGLSLCTD